MRSYVNATVVSRTKNAIQSAALIVGDTITAVGVYCILSPYLLDRSESDGWISYYHLKCETVIFFLDSTFDEFRKISIQRRKLNFIILSLTSNSLYSQE